MKNVFFLFKNLLKSKKKCTFASKLTKDIPTNKTMCNISKETILRANRRVSYSISTSKASNCGNIEVSVRYGGTTFSQFISMTTIRANYGAALKHVK